MGVWGCAGDLMGQEAGCWLVSSASLLITCATLKPSTPFWEVDICSFATQPYTVGGRERKRERERKRCVLVYVSEGWEIPVVEKKVVVVVVGVGLGRIRPNQTLCADPSSPHIKDSRERSSASSAFHCSRLLLGIMCFFWPWDCNYISSSVIFPTRP